MFCREHVAQLRDHKAEIDRRDVAVAAVGTGDLMYARDFAEDKRVNFPLYVDDAKASYKAVGTRKGSARSFAKPRVIASAARVTAKGHIQGKLGPAHMVLGATHVIRPDGSVAFAWVNGDFDDNADFAEALRSLD
ncbi:MAG TPA: AhpC/TSA family protein [Egibacteraceae bacterium]|nr:AhpC/TSA family protein [Egibacteraceae bacterium]